MAVPDPLAAEAASHGRHLRFDRLEWAGALGDVGTLIPFLVAYTGIAGLPAFGILFSFGAALIVCGLYYRTPFPVQPMKATGAVVATQASALGLGVQSVYAASILTGAVWLLLAATGLAKRVAALASRPVVMGIVLGLGISFMLKGVEMIAAGWLLGSVALVGALLLLGNRVVPAMFAVLLFGAVVALVQSPALAGKLMAMRPQLHWPQWSLAQATWHDWSIAFVFLVLPQLPLTLGNAVIAITEENNRLFPDRPITEQRVATSTGVMNLLGGVVGAVPMCHGAGGMAGHVRFGARSGGAPVILGTLLLLLALFFSESADLLLKLFPTPILGTILFLTGAQLALGACNFSDRKTERFVTVVTTGLAIWNVGAGFVAGLLLDRMLRRGWVRL